MKQLLVLAVTLILPAAVVAAGPDYPIVPVPFTAVQLAPGFWQPRLETNRTVTVPFALQKCQDTGRIDNFAVAGKLQAGTFKGLRYDDSDVYKTIEAAAYTLAQHPDPALAARLDGIIAKIAAAQEPDGYLYTMRTILGAAVPANAGAERWSNLRDSHELYNVGHMYEAAVAHHQATGRRTLLDVALRNADFLLTTFGEGKRIAVPGHQEIELGLVKLYRTTGRRAYLDLARFFLDMRGRADRRPLYVYDWLPSPYNRYYAQDFAPVTAQTEAVGHAVRAGYMYAGMTDLTALTGDAAYRRAVDTLWRNVVGRKMYLTGGVGASESGEDFGENFDLPNATAYNETCAAIAQIFWHHRLFLLTGDGRYLDVLERILYNGFLSGVSLSGDRFFYPNPLASDGRTAFNEGGATRVPWFQCACCPPNIARLMASLPGYVYAQTGRTVYVNQFVNGTARLSVDGVALRLTQQSDYPWQGDIRIRVEPDAAATFTLRVRVPGWARHEAIPGGLYRFLDRRLDAVTLVVNGRPVPVKPERGFAVIARHWQPGDTVTLHLPLPVRTVGARDDVAANRGRIAFQRGPIVFCAEGVDNANRVLDLAIPLRDESRTDFDYTFRSDLLGGVGLLTGTARRRGAEQRERITLVPYYAWSHRGAGEMTVWFPAEVPVRPPRPLAE
ncbi:MAG TPA: glycoside hydrolase family 127 protein [Acidobacteriota bacterium]|nr:glycoside hydrolase family 127 protein [Acidobacteriota bacterium]HQG90758.1 glycoside hydrolase family 127 protein [Acidobacteriota bacterium]HQK86266.1 glycoside hydrolase family 127 protein [Acidobacteriota bacterium]